MLRRGAFRRILLEKLNQLELDVIDHRSWHPRPPSNILINEVYVKDTEECAEDGFDVEKYIDKRTDEVRQALAGAIHQDDSVIRVQRWYPDVFHDSFEDPEELMSERILRATGAALETSRQNLNAAEILRREAASRTRLRRYGWGDLRNRLCCFHFPPNASNQSLGLHFQWST